MDASASDLSSTDEESVAAATPVVRSRFLRAMNYFSGEKTVVETPAVPLAGPAPVVVIRDSDEDAADDMASPRDEASDEGVAWRQGLMAMEGIELPEFEDLDSLPASRWDDDDRGVILSPWNACWDTDESSHLASEQAAWNDPRQLWLNTEESQISEADRERSDASKVESQVERQPVFANEVDTEAETNHTNFGKSERQDIMSTAGLKPNSETAVVPPAQETKLWPGLEQPGKKPLAESNGESVVVATDKEWSAHAADVAFVAAILKDVEAPDTETEAVFEESEAETVPASDRGSGVKLVPGWKPLRGGTGSEIGAGGGDIDNFESSGDEMLSGIDAAEKENGEDEEGAETQTAATVEGESDDNAEVEPRSIVRTPLHDSIVEGFGNFLSDSIVLDAAFTEPDFKALNPDDLTSADVDAESSCDVASETETATADTTELPISESEDTAKNEDTVSEVAADSDVQAEASETDAEVADEPSDSVAASPLSLSQEVVAPSEMDRDDVVPAAIVVPSLIDAEEDANEIELSELGMAGLSVLGAEDGEGEASSLLDRLAGEEADDLKPNDEEKIDRFGSLSDEQEQEQSSTATAGGFSLGNSALVRHGVSCPACDQTLRIQNRYIGIEGRCPGCSEMIVARCLASGLVVADLAEVEAPKFFQQPDIEPGDVWGGTRLAPGGGLGKDSEGEGSVECGPAAELDSQAEVATTSGADQGGQILVSEDLAKLQWGQADTEGSVPDDDKSAATNEPVVDPFSNPSRLVVDQSNEADGIWGPEIGKSRS